MDSLKQEMMRKRKQLEKSEVVDPEKKFFKRGDLAAKQTEDYWRKHNEKHAVGAPSTLGQELDSEKLLDEENEEKTVKPMARKDVIRRLRARHEPIRLFGETDDEAVRRLRRLEIDQPDMKPGWKNDFQEAMESVDKEYLKEVIDGKDKDDRHKHDVKTDSELQNFEEIKARLDNQLGKGSPATDCEIIFQFFNYLAQRWGFELNARDEDVKRSRQGKLESGLYAQSMEHLKPLTSSLKKKSVADDIREKLVHIVKCMLQRDYILANNAYMELAIGNAPWPVGVTRSGIHQRPGSAKSYVSNIAHVLNDETQRKYIQSVKRLLSKCQHYFPTDPSKSVEFINHNER